MDIKNIDVLNIHRIDYRCFVFRISKNEGMYILKKSELMKKEDICKV